LPARTALYGLPNIAAEGFDAGIRLGQFIAADMVAVRLTRPFPLGVVGSPDYLRRRRPPERVDDLREHACLRMRRSNGSIAPWTFLDGNKTVGAVVSGPLIAHDLPTLLGAALRGLGLVQVPHPMARAALADGRLQAVLAPYAVTGPGVFLYYPGKRQALPKLRAFIEHVKWRSAELRSPRRP
jgi:DNA-binding transcriptional LysR family regulator